MSSPTPQSAQEEALLQQLTEDRERRRAALRAAAESQAKQIVRSARAEARSTVQNAVIQERTRMESGMRQAAAHADFEARRREWQKSRELLEQMWALIAGALERRWREPALRRAWIEAAIGQAAALLPGRAWLIESGSNLTEQERGELIDRAQGHGAGTVKWSLQPAMPVGLRIRADKVCVDASVVGLLAQRESIEAAFLAEYLPAPAPTPAATEKRTDG